MLDDILNAVSEYLDFAVDQQGQTHDFVYTQKPGNAGAQAGEQKRGNTETLTGEQRSEIGGEISADKGETNAPNEEATSEPVLKERVEEASLTRISAMAKNSDIAGIAGELEQLAQNRYGTEDTEFLQALADQAKEANMDAILDMIDTYRALKKA